MIRIFFALTMVVAACGSDACPQFCKDECEKIAACEGPGDVDVAACTKSCVYWNAKIYVPSSECEKLDEKMPDQSCEEFMTTTAEGKR